MTEPRKLFIGLSPRILRRPPVELGFAGKTLQYLEQSVAHWVMSLGHLVVMVPTVEREGLLRRSQISTADYASALDGLVLQGGADIDPAAYGEPLLHAVGPLDAVRDSFELELIHAFIAQRKPVFGICRGMQLINVALGGTLHQDLQKNGVTTKFHATSAYDAHVHDLSFHSESWMADIYGIRGGRVNSIHHQGVNRIGRDLTAEAYSDDGVIEAIHGTGDSFVLGVQWHPEFHDGRIADLLPADPLLQSFLDAAAKRREEA